MNKNRNVFANLDRDTLCFMLSVLIMAGIAVPVSWNVFETGTAAGAAKEDGQSVEARKDTIEKCGGTYADLQLPARTNTGDTLYVLGKKSENSNSVYAQTSDGNKRNFVFDGADRVKSGDTIVVNSKHNFLMKNITQRNLERQK